MRRSALRPFACAAPSSVRQRLAEARRSAVPARRPWRRSATDGTLSVARTAGLRAGGRSVQALSPPATAELPAPVVPPAASEPSTRRPRRRAGVRDLDRSDLVAHRLQRARLGSYSAHSCCSRRRRTASAPATPTTAPAASRPISMDRAARPCFFFRSSCMLFALAFLRCAAGAGLARRLPGRRGQRRQRGRARRRPAARRAVAHPGRRSARPRPGPPGPAGRRSRRRPSRRASRACLR